MKTIHVATGLVRKFELKAGGGFYLVIFDSGRTEWLTPAQARSAKVGDRVELAYRASASRGEWVVAQVLR